MNYSEYMNQVLKTLHSLREDFEFSTRVVLKNNDVSLDALMARVPGQNLIPTLYFQNLYEEFTDFYDENPEYLPIQCQRILDRIDPDRTPVPDHYLLDFSDFEDLKDRIVLRIISREMNPLLLNDVPHRDYLDLSIVYYILLDTKEDLRHEMATALIHNSNLECWGTTEEELYRLAVSNTPKLLPPRIRDIESIIGEILCSGSFRNNGEDPEEDDLLFSDTDEDASAAGEMIRHVCSSVTDHCPMYVLSNPTRLYGAAAILYPGLLEKYREELGCGFFVLPSSVHETILLPFHDGLKPEHSQIEELRDLVRQINEENVSPIERLTDSVYTYDSPEKGLCL